MTNVEQIDVSDSDLETTRRKNRDRKRAQRTREKAAKAAEIETLNQAWGRHSEKLKQNEPALYARLFQRHQDFDDLEAEIADCEDGRIEATRHIAECWRDTQNEFEKYGECNYGAIDRGEGFHPSGATYDALDPYRWFGFHTHLSADLFFRITKCFLQFALTTKGESFDPAIVDAAVSDFTKRFSQREINPVLTSLIRVHRGLPANELPLYEFLKASDGFRQLVPRSIAEMYRNKNIIFRSPAQLESLSEGRRNLE